MMDLIDGKWFNANEILSHNCDINIVCAKREIGKSYGTLKRAIARRIRNGEAAFWLRFTENEAMEQAARFGSGNWKKIAESLGVDMSCFKRKGKRIFYRKDEKSDWLPLIRYAGLTEWHNLRDTDEPDEKTFVFDEFIVPTSKLNRYQGEPARDLLDLWQTLRRGKERMPIIAYGNPELGVDWLTPYLINGDDRMKPEQVVKYRTKPDILDRTGVDRIAVLWTTNPNGHSAGGSDSGIRAGVPVGLERHRSGHEILYLACDVGNGFISIWDAGGKMIVDTYDNGRDYVWKLAPDGDCRTRVMSISFKQWLTRLNSAFISSRVFYANGEAYRRFTASYKALLRR